MKEFKYHYDNGLELVNKPPAGFKFLGGKADDITVTVAQVFADTAGEDDPRRSLAANDTYFSDAKHLYTGPVPSNSKEGFLRARFNDRPVPSSPGDAPQN